MYFKITAKVEEANDTSYEREVKQPDGADTIEQVLQYELSLTVPGMRDRVRVTFAADVAPKPDDMARWELEETWVVISADTLRAAAFTGAKGATALVSFTGVEVREATAAERKDLQAARQALKAKQKQRRAQAKADKTAAKKAHAASAA